MTVKPNPKRIAPNQSGSGVEEKIANDIFEAMIAYGDARARGEMVFPPAKDSIAELVSQAVATAVEKTEAKAEEECIVHDEMLAQEYIEKVAQARKEERGRKPDSRYVQPVEDCDHPYKGMKLIHGYLCGYCGTIWNDKKTKEKYGK